MENSIVLYSTGCPKCEVLKTKLTTKQIEFTENTSVDDMIALGLTYAPALSVSGELMDFSTAIKWINAH